MPDEAVKVAVRVRPFNQREKDRKSKCIIKMEGQMTLISNPDTPNAPPKEFSFDYSYWSHDGFETDGDGVMKPTNKHYSDQQRVFEDLGQGVLDNAWEGYNCSLFAYGQTGSGKSYSMVGYGPNRGIVPITCDELFKAIDSNKDDNKKFQVQFSMLEIYNEAVRDLFCKDNTKGGLQVRQNPKLGFYVEGLKKVPVGSYKDIEKRMDQGTANRTVASTNMNATSSRAHTVVTIVFEQIITTDQGQTKKSSTMNLVDLAGSERADSTGATGDRLKEGANINKSLSALGNVISALADQCMGKKKIVVPYRDSVLTKLLQNALGGNSKTVMIAALSPADINHDETLSTLRYADRAKKIKTKATINENPLDKLVRELKEENDRLKKMMSGDTSMMSQTAGLSPEEIAEMRRNMEAEIRSQLSANMDALQDQESWDAKVQEARNDSDISGSDNDKNQRKKQPYLVNLNEDPMLSGVINHFINLSGSTRIGRKDADSPPDICLSGLSIVQEHATIESSGKEVTIKPSSPGAKTKLNGAPLTGTINLAHKDRLLFGSNHMYVFMNPLQQEQSKDLPPSISWDFAQKEIAEAKGFVTGVGLSKDQQVAQEKVLEILPMVSEVNAISEELNKHKTFEVVLISPAAQESKFGQEKSTKVMVKMKNLLNNNTWLWERGKFMNRRYVIQDQYQKWIDGGGEDTVDMAQEDDPFWEPTEDILIGSASVFLQSLAYGLDFDDKLAIADYKGDEEGTITVSVAPCTTNGQALDEDFFVDEPRDLLGKPFSFKVKVDCLDVKKAQFSKGLKVKYRIYDDEKLTETNIVKGTLTPAFNHCKQFNFAKLLQVHLDWFESGCISFQVFGTQEDIVSDTKRNKMTTRELRQMEQLQRPGLTRQQTQFSVDTSEQGQLKSEYALLQHKFERLAQKEKRLQEICKTWAEKPPNEKKFEGFYNAVRAVAFSTGTRLKTRVQVLNKVLRMHKMLKAVREEQESTENSNMLAGQRLIKQLKNQNGQQDGQSLSAKNRPKTANDAGDSLVSVYIHGLEEQTLASKAAENAGVLSYSDVRSHFGECKRELKMLATNRAAKENGHASSGKTKGGNEKGATNVNNKETSKACVVQ